MVSFGNITFKLNFVSLQKHPSETSRNLLNDDDDSGDAELTHFGRSLSEVENFRDAIVSESDEDSDSGRISGESFTLTYLTFSLSSP